MYVKFFCYNVYLLQKSRSCLLHRTIFCKKCLQKQIFFQNGGTLGYKYLFRLKDHYSPIECIPSFFVVMCICLTKYVLFLLHRTIFCKKCLHKQFFLKMVEPWDINIYFVWKTSIVPLSVCRVSFVIICICLTNHVLFSSTERYFVNNAYISNFFSKWWNSGI